MQDNFMDLLKETTDRVQNNISVTENGAIGYKTTGKALLDLNFKLSSMRNWDEDKIWTEFLVAYNENPALAVVWLMFSRDVMGGCGERRTFRVIIQRLTSENPDLVIKLLPLIPEYGRWDDVVEIFCGDVPCKVRDEALALIAKQLHEDAGNAMTNKPVSLAAKWLPSLATSSKDTRRKAEQIRTALGVTPKQYRKVLSSLRSYLKIVEQKISANQWHDVNYESVPSKAGLLYRDAFSRHDGDRYNQYLEDVRSGKSNMNADVLFPYEIVHAYMGDSYWDDDQIKPYDETLELKWKNLPNTVTQDNGTLVVVDGSGSMSTQIGGTKLTCHDVARSLGIYFAERLPGPFRNSFITFSACPKVVRFNGVESLRNKLEILVREDDCSNTDIEKTFDLILRTAVENHMKQEEMPANVLIISDLEFDSIGGDYNWETGKWSADVDTRLFDAIARKFEDFGYKLPRLVFWNVCSRSETIPVKENDLGVALVSGFSQNIADMVLSGELDPWKLLVDKLHSERYQRVWEAVMPS